MHYRLPLAAAAALAVLVPLADEFPQIRSQQGISHGTVALLDNDSPKSVGAVRIRFSSSLSFMRRAG